MKIICIGRNFVEHAKELQNEVPSEPVIFLKPKTALVRKGSPMIYPEFTDDLQYEGEIVLHICKNGKNITAKNANQYYNKATIGIDFTARDLQSKLKAKGLPWEIAKGFDGSAVIGELVDIQHDKFKDAKLSLHRNGEQVQSGSAKDMLFNFDKIVSYASKYFTLQIGDLIFTGTPAGVGSVLPYDKFEGYLNDEKLLTIDIR